MSSHLLPPAPSLYSVSSGADIGAMDARVSMAVGLHEVWDDDNQWAWRRMYAHDSDAEGFDAGEASLRKAEILDAWQDPARALHAGATPSRFPAAKGSLCKDALAEEVAKDTRLRADVHAMRCVARISACARALAGIAGLHPRQRAARRLDQHAAA